MSNDIAAQFKGLKLHGMALSGRSTRPVHASGCWRGVLDTP